MRNVWKNWGNFVAASKTRWVTLLIWVAIVAVVSVIWPQVNDETTGGSQLLPEDAMSVEASNIADEQFPNDAGVPLLLVWHRDGGLEQEDLADIQEFYSNLEEDPLEYQSMIPPFAELPPQALLESASEDEEALTTPVFFSTEANAEDLQPVLATVQERITEVTGENYFDTDLSEDGMHVRYTGAVGIQVDSTELFSNADVTLLIATVLLVLFLLVILYRSPILAVVPLVAVGFAYGIISPLLGFFADQGWIVVDSQAASIMTVLLFGAGTDYCLFLITRYRDELLMEPNKYKAITKAIAHSGGAIVISALTTAVGLFTLVLAQYASYDRFAVPFSVAIIIMAIAVLTLLPAILALIGRAAFFPFIPRTESMIKELESKKGKKVRRPKTRSRFSKWTGNITVRKPWTIIVVTVVVLGILALFVPRINYTYGVFDSFPEDMPSREGFSIIGEHYPDGEVAPAQVLVKTEEDVSLQEDIASLDNVESVGEPETGEEDASYKQYSVTLSIDPYSEEAVNFVPELKNEVEGWLEEAGVENPEDQVWINGETAGLYDTEQVTSSDQNLIIPVVLVIIALILVSYLKSVVAMGYLLLTVGLSYLSALGLGWIIIHYFMGASAMQGLIPLYSFVFLVALGNDYNIFMISSIWKNREHMKLDEAISDGVSSTSSVITSAGLILAGTFAVLAVLPLQVLVQFGTVTAVGVLIDTFVVRPFLVPAITKVLGRYSFWPAKISKTKDDQVYVREEK
ncbi:MMPL family transporter [Salimicrobium halophilum]|uniref:Putative drug exporter of the RND superfamily n=1 Tax=Salimicrobium halophilum TaxID=86666 RepID=A0A1G8SVA4_9BACI|nr:MMPL family transporter [Salimicrobium halophilum]SDJ33179.1 putative drug exporter of the RND superfamily [Salimicrobium halophilum]